MKTLQNTNPEVMIKHHKKQIILALLLVVGAATIHLASAEAETAEEKASSLTLITATPEEGFQLAISLARKGVTETQTDREALFELREVYSRDADSLIAASQVIAIHFQTISAANDYWREE